MMTREMTMTMNAPNPKAYQALVELAVERGLPKRFETDLIEHDRARLMGEDAPKVFGWLLYEHGTHLIDPRSGSRHVEGYIKHAQVSGRDEGFVYCVWTGDQLQVVDAETWAEIMRAEVNQPRPRVQIVRSFDACGDCVVWIANADCSGAEEGHVDRMEARAAREGWDLGRMTVDVENFLPQEKCDLCGGYSEGTRLVHELGDVHEHG